MKDSRKRMMFGCRTDARIRISFTASSLLFSPTKHVKNHHPSPHTTLCLHTSHSAFCSACPQSSSHRSCPCPSWSHATQSRTSLSQETHPCGTRAPSPLPAASLLHTRSAAKVKMRSSTPSLLPSFPSLPLRTAEHFNTPAIFHTTVTSSHSFPFQTHNKTFSHHKPKNPQSFTVHILFKPFNRLHIIRDNSSPTKRQSHEMVYPLNANQKGFHS